MQIAKPGFAAVDLATCVYLDIEATGLEPKDEVVAIGIVDAAGTVRLDTLVRPRRKKTWPPHPAHPRHQSRRRGHGADVAAVGPRHPGGRTRLPRGRVRARTLTAALWATCWNRAPKIHCCRQAWARHVGKWSPYAGPPRRYRWHKLVDAAADVEFDWERAGGGPHTPIPAAQACRAVWIFLQDRLLWACIWGSREAVAGVVPEA